MSLEENAKYGFIKLFRSIRKHWLWQDATKLKWWIDILIEINHEEKKVVIGNQIITCKKGQSVKSLGTWAKEWKVSPATVKRFLELLQKDSMIVIENVQKTTRLTVCNYESYTEWRNDDETMMKRFRNDDETIVKTNNNGNKEKNDKKGDTVAGATAHDQLQKYGFVIKTDLLKVCEFIRENKPTILEPYVDLWNLFCDSRLGGKRKVQELSIDRKRKIKTRVREEKFDLEHILKIAKDSTFLINDWQGFDFDWIIENSKNYDKIVRGRYGNNQTKDEIKQHHDDSEYLKKRQENEKRIRERIDGTSATA